MTTYTLPYSMLAEFAAEAGAAIVGVTSSAPHERAIESLRVWQGSGFGADMAYMHRDPAQLGDPQRYLADARSIVTFAFSYGDVPPADCPPGFGRVARYAWGADYHSVIPTRLESIIERTARMVGQTLSARAFSDAVPLMERSFAERAGLGFIGRHSLLISPGSGSYNLLGGIVWNLEVSETPAAPHKGSCGTCVRCRESCPTGAIVADGVVDARRCISYLSIEKSGVLTAEERGMLGSWVFGCDVCQEVCPFNHAPQKEQRGTRLEAFKSRSGVGPILDLMALFEVRTERAFRERFAGTALLRPRRSGLLRNAMCVAGNTNFVDAVPLIEDATRHDTSPVVRATGLGVLDDFCKKGVVERRSLAMRLDGARLDPDARVREEAERILAHGTPEA